MQNVPASKFNDNVMQECRYSRVQRECGSTLQYVDVSHLIDDTPTFCWYPVLHEYPQLEPTVPAHGYDSSPFGIIPRHGLAKTNRTVENKYLTHIRKNNNKFKTFIEI